MKPCVVEGCTRQSHKGARYCSMHSERLRTKGDVGPPEPLIAPAGAGSVTAQGYRVERRADHPLAGAQGKVLQHRRVLFDAIGPGEHPCHWCGKTVRWTEGVTADSLIADHVNLDRLDNRAKNLVPSCNQCNTTRSQP